MEEATICTTGNAVGVSLDERFAIMRSIGLESIDEDDVRRLLGKNVAPVCYVWCDPSPLVHVAQGIMMVIKIRKMVEAGCRVKILIADWFACMQNKFDGDLTKIRSVGFYMIEIWKAVGLELNTVQFIWLSDEINSHSDEYWALVMDISRNNTLRTMIRCCGILDPYILNEEDRIVGSYDHEDVVASTLFTPCVQCACILFQKADIWLLSMDHEEDLHHKLVRQYCKGMEHQHRPIILSYSKLPNLIEHPEFAKNGDPACAIYMEDREVNLRDKLSRAFCPAKVAEGNPCLEYIKYIVFPWFGYFEVLRKEENGGSRMFQNMEELITDYESGALDATEVKLALTEALSKILKPVRDYFANSCKAKNLEEAMLGVSLNTRE
ncbi:tyrosine--tRNA ligase 1, cytoplasmic [Lolium perenne]|uniref:tyrosine--tRNA ligase 1, cytoplasmic n=1 Tax=Lolium perenne TaxID=4522 RepID=UPI0021F5E8AE|nr:tyrosine--tRNA ligase 1, cytoplasmic-like [Lolium perenne]XP_051177761.1 tyrosine--tRNA ligase 1, cytoplasmic-like [Lolium perenne]